MLTVSYFQVGLNWNEIMVISLQELEVECELQRTLRDEAEVAMRLLEKEIHEKQDTIFAMKRQLADVKAINSQLYDKLQVHMHLIFTIYYQVFFYAYQPY